MGTELRHLCLSMWAWPSAAASLQGDVFGLFRASDLVLMGGTVLLLLSSQAVFWRGRLLSGGTSGGGGGGGDATPFP